ncbi:hypothetical protein AAG570_008428 [Ranatra chinensis]|uniref:Uncharacterized protein n=1 Tax=Ranatra chinensis TaxID=642074 RepID=A0ABD0YT19_9HEMI
MLENANVLSMHEYLPFWETVYFVESYHQHSLDTSAVKTNTIESAHPRTNTARERCEGTTPTRIGMGRGAGIVSEVTERRGEEGAERDTSERHQGTPPTGRPQLPACPTNPGGGRPSTPTSLLPIPLLQSIRYFPSGVTRTIPTHKPTH